MGKRLERRASAVEADGLRATVFAIPGRIAEEGASSPFVTWSQLGELQTSGAFDVQSHTRSHAMIFSTAEIVDFVTPAFAHEPLLNRPITSMNGRVHSVSGDALGTPLHVRRSRMSDARRFVPDEAVADRCRAHVEANGGRAFFDRPEWRRELQQIASRARGEFERDDERAAAITRELADGRAC